MISIYCHYKCPSIQYSILHGKSPIIKRGLVHRLAGAGFICDEFGFTGVPFSISPLLTTSQWQCGTWRVISFESIQVGPTELCLGHKVLLLLVCLVWSLFAPQRAYLVHICSAPFLFCEGLEGTSVTHGVGFNTEEFKQKC
jgi:hypothetical protein